MIFGPVTGGWLLGDQEEKEKEVDKTYYPYYGPLNEKETAQHEQLKEWLAKDKVYVEECVKLYKEKWNLK